MTHFSTGWGKHEAGARQVRCKHKAGGHQGRRTSRDRGACGHSKVGGGAAGARVLPPDLALEQDRRRARGWRASRPLLTARHPPRCAALRRGDGGGGVLSGALEENCGGLGWRRRRRQGEQPGPVVAPAAADAAVGVGRVPRCCPPLVPRARLGIEDGRLRQVTARRSA